MDNSHESPVRLQVYLSKCGIGSRRACERLITAGDIQVNGKIIQKQGVKVVPTDRILYRGKPVRLNLELKYFALNKPVRYLCAMSDTIGRACAVDLLKDAAGDRIYHVGRLDYMSSGLIFFTNDGFFAQAVMHPSKEIEKEYLVETKQQIDRGVLMEFKRGLEIDGVFYKINWFTWRNDSTIKIVLTEGKNREIRKLFASKKIDVKRLHRTRIGPVNIRGIPSGGWRPLSRQEINFFIPR